MPRHEMTLPDLGFGEAPILASLWLVELGATVVKGDPILEILAGCAVVDLPAEADGVLVEMLVGEDDLLRPDQPLAVIEWDEDS